MRPRARPENLRHVSVGVERNFPGLYFSDTMLQNPRMAEPKDVRGEQSGPDLAKLYPSLSPAELEQAQENFRQYVALALRVFERLESDPEAMARFDALIAFEREHCRNMKGREDNQET